MNVQSDSVTAQEERRSGALPEPTRHSIKVRDGRILAYYTFDKDGESASVDADEEKARRDARQPVIYLHGFPGTGEEGAVCATQVANAGGRLFAPDRPGFGHSDPLPDATNGNADERIKATVDDLWDLARSLGWSSFSLIGVSGGGPYALAVLASYLDAKQSPVAKIDAISIVGGALPAAGTDGMMPSNQALFRLVNTNSWWSELQLSLTFGAMTVLSRVVPSNMLLSMGPMKDLPPVDQNVMKDPVIGPCMAEKLKLSLRQGSAAAALEAKALFRPKLGFEDTLKSSGKARLEEETSPKVAIFHGKLDVNVPLSHALYAHRELLHETSKLVEYEEHGHLSLVAKKGDDYARFAITSAL